MTVTLYNVRTAITPGTKPLLSDFSAPTIVCYDPLNALVWGKVNGVVVPVITVYPYDSEVPILNTALVDNGEAKYSTVKKQFRVIADTTPELSDFTYPTMRCYDSAEAAIYEKLNGQLVKSYTCYPYIPRTESAEEQYYVSTTGSNSNTGRAGYPWLTLVHAINSVTGPATINIAAGTYNNTSLLNLRTGVSIIGAGSANTIINSTYHDDNLNLYSATYVDGNQTIKGFTLNGLNTGHSAIYCRNRSKVTFEDLIIQNFTIYGLLIGNTDENGLTLCSNNTVKDCRFINNSTYQSGGSPANLWIVGQTGLTVTGNYVESTFRTGDLAGFAFKASNLENSLIDDNEFKVIDHDDELRWCFAAEINNTRGSVIVSNNVLQGIVDIAGTNTVKGSYSYSIDIKNNIIGHHTLSVYGNSAILLEAGIEMSDVFIRNNTFKNVIAAIRFTPLNSNIIQRVHIHQNLMYGIGKNVAGANGFGIWGLNDMPAATIKDVEVYNNTIVATTESIGTQWSGICLPSGCITQNWHIANNIIVGFDVAPVMTAVTPTSGTIDVLNLIKNCFYDNGNTNAVKWLGITPSNIYELNTLTSDPLLKEDYHLNLGSPCIDTGFFVGLPYTDWPDRGCFEY